MLSPLMRGEWIEIGYDWTTLGTSIVSPHARGVD